jgi:hypothetical protein
MVPNVLRKVTFFFKGSRTLKDLEPLTKKVAYLFETSGTTW